MKSKRIIITTTDEDGDHISNLLLTGLSLLMSNKLSEINICKTSTTTVENTNQEES